MTEKEKIPAQELFFRLSEAGNGPWEINRPQTIIINLVEKGLFNGKVLDIGCGIGDNAIYIAKQTNNVNITAFDLVHLIFKFLLNLYFFFRFPRALRLLVKKPEKIK